MFGLTEKELISLATFVGTAVAAIIAYFVKQKSQKPNRDRRSDTNTTQQDILKILTDLKEAQAEVENSRRADQSEIFDTRRRELRKIHEELNEIDANIKDSVHKIELIQQEILFHVQYLKEETRQRKLGGK